MKIRSLLTGVSFLAMTAPALAAGVCQPTADHFQEVATRSHDSLIEVTGQAARNVETNFNKVPPPSDVKMARVFFAEDKDGHVILLWAEAGDCAPQGIPLPGKDEEKRLMQKDPPPFDSNKKAS